MLVGEYGAFCTCGLQLLQQLFRSGQEVDFEEQIVGPQRAVDGDRLRQKSFVFLSENPGDGGFEAASDGSAHLLHCRSGEAKVLARLRVGAMDRCKVVQQRAIQVEEYGLKAGHNLQLVGHSLGNARKNLRFAGQRTRLCPS